MHDLNVRFNIRIKFKIYDRIYFITNEKDENNIGRLQKGRNRIPFTTFKFEGINQKFLCVFTKLNVVKGMRFRPFKIYHNIQ